jgi:glycosyltransferase involved in cell wall biosynthesis
MPNAALEAMACGLPAVAPNVGGVPDVIAHGRTGLLAAAGDPESFAAQIAAVMRDPMLGTRLGTAARAEVRGRFSFDRMVGAMEGLYLRQLAQRGGLHAQKAA